jgi:DNA replication protein DnaC
MDERYRNKRFDELDLSNKSFKIAFDRCKKYCEVAEEVLKKGYGIYLYGNSGTGKTLLTSCMANELMEKEYTVLFTNFFEILKAIRNTYNNSSTETDDSIINSITEVDFLFIDDLGTESLSKNDGDNFTQDKIFEIINKRYNKQKPTIFSSNYHIRELVGSRNFMDKTVDRINEMSSLGLKIEGESYRTKKVMSETIPF